MQACGLSRLDVCRPLAFGADDEDHCRHLTTERVTDGEGDGVTDEGTGKDVEEPGAPVGQGQQGQGVQGGGVVPAGSHRLRSLSGRESAGEAVRGDDDMHASTLARTAPPRRHRFASSPPAPTTRVRSHRDAATRHTKEWLGIRSGV